MHRINHTTRDTTRFTQHYLDTRWCDEIETHTGQRCFDTALRIDSSPGETSGDRVARHETSGYVGHAQRHQLLGGYDLIIVHSSKR